MNRRIAVGDIHGCQATLKTLLEEKIKLTFNDQIYCVGDLIDRGPSSRDVLDYLIHLKKQGYQIFSLRGNHEDMLLKALDDISFMQAWFANGAEETLRSFNIPETLIYDYEGLKSIPENYISFLESLPYYYDLGDYLIVHAGLNFNAEDIFKDLNSMLWIRHMEYSAEKAGNRIIIHGHTPIPLALIKPYITFQKNKILNIDSGCVYNDLPGYGILTGLNLDTRELYTQENRDI